MHTFNTFIAWLDSQITKNEEAETEFQEGYIDALKDVRSQFNTENNTTDLRVVA